jgi:hypothetical protein
MVPISQRDPDALHRWASMKESYTEMGSDAFRLDGEKYEAVRVTNNTVEVRIFRGNMREDRIRKAIECVVATLQLAKVYAKQSAYGKMVQPLPNDKTAFLSYVDEHKERYPNLYTFIHEKKVH